MIWQSPGLPGWRKVNFITVTRRPHHPNITTGLFCLHGHFTGISPILFARSGVGSFTCIESYISPIHGTDGLKSPPKDYIGNEDKAPCPRALLPGRGSNRGPPVWKSEALTARPRQLLNPSILFIEAVHTFHLCFVYIDQWAYSKQRTDGHKG